MQIQMQDIHILIVDDEESLRITFEMFLKREGYGRVTTVASMEEALLAINEEHFDLIISDIVLEGAKGTELLKYINQTGVQCPVILITGFPNIDTASDAVRYGAFDYIPKPVNKETLLRFVRQALKHWELEQEKNRLQKENEKFRRYLEMIFSSVSDAIITVNEKMEIVQLNNTAGQWFGESRNAQYKHLKDLPGEMGHACFLDATKVVNKNEIVRDHNVEGYKPDGSMRMVSLNAAPIMDSSEEFTGAVIVMRDITPSLPELHRAKRSSFHGFIGVSNVMQDIYQMIENVGKVDTAVLITGESGTGKEFAGEALHAESRRAKQHLVKVDCAAMPEDLLESELFGHKKGAFTGADRDRIGRIQRADKGTLFLDEIGDISFRMQLRLLRFLQEKTFSPVGQDTFAKVDVRIIAATNVNLRKKVQDGFFREDLYYRLKVVEVLLPPLRQRADCIPLLVHHFLEIFRETLSKEIYSVTDQAMEILQAYLWPGNVRELRHVIERACVLCNDKVLTKEHLADEIVFQVPEKNDIRVIPEKIQAVEPGKNSKQRAFEHLVSEEEQIIEAIWVTGGNKAKAAKILGIDRSTLYRKMKKYNM